MKVFVKNIKFTFEVISNFINKNKFLKKKVFLLIVLDLIIVRSSLNNVFTCKIVFFCYIFASFSIRDILALMYKMTCFKMFKSVKSCFFDPWK